MLSAAEARQMLDSIQSSTLTTIFQLIARLTVSLLSTSGDYEATVTPPTCAGLTVKSPVATPEIALGIYTD